MLTTVIGLMQTLGSSLIMISRSQTRNAPWLGSPFLHKLHTNNDRRSQDIGAHSSRCVLKLELADQKKELADPGRQPVIVRCRK